MKVTPRGRMMFLYQEKVNLEQEGRIESVVRASDVEPDERGEWWVTIRNQQRTKLGPFRRRSEALKAEVDWLERNSFSTVPNVPCADGN